MKIKLWAMALAVVAGLPTLTVQAQVYYSPVFNMPLQPAPSPRNGGFYWVTPDGRTFGPNYCLRPPFSPMAGFDTTFVSQKIFAAMLEEAITGKPNKGGPGGAQQGKQVGVGGYNMDYSDPKAMQSFDASSQMPNGYTPFAGNPQGPSGPPPQQSASRYPNYYSPYPPPNYGYGYGPRPGGMASVGYPSNVYQAGYYGPNWGQPIVPVQYGPPPGMPNPGYAAPGQGWNGYGAQPGFNQGQYPPAGSCYPGYGNCPPCPPGLPNYAMSGLPAPGLPNYAMPGVGFPSLPNPSYEAPPCPPQQPGYTQNPLVRSPRDFWMWSETQQDLERRSRHPLTVP